MLCTKFLVTLLMTTIIHFGTVMAINDSSDNCIEHGEIQNLLQGRITFKHKLAIWENFPPTFTYTFKSKVLYLSLQLLNLKLSVGSFLIKHLC